MNKPSHSVNVQDFMSRHLVEVFETMLSKKAVSATDDLLPRCSEYVSGSVGFGGDAISGAVYLHMSASFALQAAAAMLGLPPGEITTQADINDVVGEMTNMLAGGLKSAFCDADVPCAVSTPTIIRGSSFRVEQMPDVEKICVTFDCEGERVMVEVHTQDN